MEQDVYVKLLMTQLSACAWYIPVINTHGKFLNDSGNINVPHVDCDLYFKNTIVI